jgi:hypothetical protein
MASGQEPIPRSFGLRQPMDRDARTIALLREALRRPVLESKGEDRFHAFGRQELRQSKRLDKRRGGMDREQNARHLDAARLTRLMEARIAKKWR